MPLAATKHAYSQLRAAVAVCGGARVSNLAAHAGRNRRTWVYADMATHADTGSKKNATNPGVKGRVYSFGFCAFIAGLCVLRCKCGCWDRSWDKL